MIWLKIADRLLDEMREGNNMNSYLRSTSLTAIVDDDYDHHDYDDPVIHLNFCSSKNEKEKKQMIPWRRLNTSVMRIMSIQLQQEHSDGRHPSVDHWILQEADDSSS